MSDLDLKSRLESAVRPASASAVDPEADLARGRRGRRRRRTYQLAAGTSACAVAGAAVVAGLPALGGGGDTDPSGGSVTVATTDTEGRQLTLDASDYKKAVRDHLGLKLDESYTSFGEDEPIRFTGKIPLYDDGASLAVLRISDGVRERGEPVPARCADDPAYDVCERRDLPDGTEVVVGRGDDDLLAVTWGRGGDLVEIAAHWPTGTDHNLTLDQLVDLATDDRNYINSGRGIPVRPVE